MAKVQKRKIKRNVVKAIAHIKASFNNTIITLTTPTGETIAWDSAGTIGFKGSRKSTPFAAQRAAENVADKAKKMGVREIEVRVKGPGAGRESAITALQAAGLTVRSIEDITPLPHNGCRPRKKRRV
jgi:small subunit ribosomal protein S11